MNIAFGPAGLGSVKDAAMTLRDYHDKGFKACEIAFTYGPYIKTREDAEAIGKLAKELGIAPSIHAHYWINLNSEDEEKIAKSKKRILDCLKVGTFLGAHRVVFHPGFYSKNSQANFDKQKTYEKIKKAILELQELRSERGYTPQLAPETTGKVNVFGSIEEIAQLVRDTQCSFCIDFAHILAREKDYSFERVARAFGDFSHWHLHFSGINYGEKGERNHIATKEDELSEVLNNLPSNKTYTIINEASDPVADSIKSLALFRSLQSKR